MNQLAVAQFVHDVLAQRVQDNVDRRWIWETRLKVAKYRLSKLQREEPEVDVDLQLTRQEQSRVLLDEPLLHDETRAVSAPSPDEPWRRQLQSRVRHVLLRLKSRRIA